MSSRAVLSSAVALGSRRTGALVPGLVAAAGVAGLAVLLARLEAAWLGAVWLDPLVLAILVGAIARTGLGHRPAWVPGLCFAARTLLEIAVALLGATVTYASLAAVGPAMLGGIAALVVLALAGGYALGRAFGLPARMALLVACGNAICGNSAIAAVAPVIGAEARDVSAAIAFTAVLGIVVVIGIPVLALALGLGAAQGGILAGLTVYAVPQVVAAAAPLGSLAVQAGTIAKLARVLMLGPVVVALALGRGRAGAVRPPLHRLVPPFVLAFAALAGLRSANLLPDGLVSPAATASSLLTLLAMAALGLAVDVRALATAGPRVTGAVVASLALLTGMALALIHVAG